MTYPNAHAGVKKLLTAHILMLIAVILIVAGGVYFLTSNNLITAEGLNEAALNAMLNDTEVLIKNGGVLIGVFAIGFVLAIIGFIMMLVGLVKAGKDEKTFMIGFWAVVAAVVIGVVVSLIMKTPEGETNPVVSIISTIAGYLVEICIALGIMNLAKRLNKPEMLPLGKALCVLLVIACVISIVLGLGVLGTGSIVSYIDIAGFVIGLVIVIMMLVYLAKGKKMLAEN